MNNVTAELVDRKARESNAESGVAAAHIATYV
jgi:hypothetical protein